MLLRTSLVTPQAAETTLYFHYADEFATRTLAYMLDSLVRVSRRVGYDHHAKVFSVQV